MSKSLLSVSRIWHRRVSSILFVFFLLISLTGLMLGWKSMFTTTVFTGEKPADAGESATASRTARAPKPHHWLPLDSLESAAAGALSQHTDLHAKHAERADIRMASGSVEFMFKQNYYVRVNGGNGMVDLIERRYGGWIQDLHDGAIIGGASKKIYSTIVGLALLFLTISGIYLWYKPLLIKKNKQ